MSVEIINRVRRCTIVGEKALAECGLNAVAVM